MLGALPLAGMAQMYAAVKHTVEDDALCRFVQKPGPTVRQAGEVWEEEVWPSLSSLRVARHADLVQDRHQLTLR